MAGHQKTWIVFWIVLLFAALLSACGHSNATSQSTSPPAPGPHPEDAETGGPTSVSCKNFIASLPSEYTHDWITVPEDPSNPRGTQIQVFYYAHLIEGHTPVVFFNGGPAGNSWSSFKVLHDAQRQPAYAAVPFVFIDQRGTGCSDPYPRVSRDGDLSRLALYGSRGIVADAEAIRKKLIGDSSWKIFGQSYGGMIVHRYVAVAPSSIVSATSHGFALTADPMATLTERISSQDKVLKAYLKAYPSDEAELYGLSLYLVPSRCAKSADGAHRVCGKEVLRPMMSQFGFQDWWPWIHNWIQIFIKNDTNLTKAWLDEVVFNPSFLASDKVRLADEVISHNEMNLAPTTTENCKQAYATLESSGQHPQESILNECQVAVEDPKPLSNTMKAIMALPKDLLLPDAFKEILAAHPTLPFYLYSGEVDPYSPPTIFADEIKSLGQLIHYTDFESSGHEGFFTEALVWQNLLKD